MHAGRESGPRRRSADPSLRMVWVESAGGGVIRHCEWIGRILNRHAKAINAYSQRMSCIREDVRRKRGGYLRAVPERAHGFEVGKELQVLGAKVVVGRGAE